MNSLFIVPQKALCPRKRFRNRVYESAVLLRCLALYCQIAQNQTEVVLLAAGILLLVPRTAVQSSETVSVTFFICGASIPVIVNTKSLKTYVLMNESVSYEELI